MAATIYGAYQKHCPTFDGKTDFDQWIDNVKRLAKMCNFGEEQKILMLIFHSKKDSPTQAMIMGVIAQYQHVHGEAAGEEDFDKIVSLIRKELKPERERSYWAEIFWKLRQSQEEDASEFYARCKAKFEAFDRAREKAFEEEGEVSPPQYDQLSADEQSRVDALTVDPVSWPPLPVPQK